MYPSFRIICLNFLGNNSTKRHKLDFCAGTARKIWDLPKAVTLPALLLFLNRDKLLDKGFSYYDSIISNFQYSMSQPNLVNGSCIQPITISDLWLVEKLETWSERSGVESENCYCFVILLNIVIVNCELVSAVDVQICTLQ